LAAYVDEEVANACSGRVQHVPVLCGPGAAAMICWVATLEWRIGIGPFGACTVLMRCVPAFLVEPLPVVVVSLRACAGDAGRAWLRSGTPSPSRGLPGVCTCPQRLPVSDVPASGSCCRTDSPCSSVRSWVCCTGQGAVYSLVSALSAVLVVWTRSVTAWIAVRCDQSRNVSGRPVLVFVVSSRPRSRHGPAMRGLPAVSSRWGKARSLWVAV
jgi:hypothetical protein